MFEGRVVLIGDSAHAVLPTVGTGATLAMESAAVLAEELCLADSSWRDIERALQHYQLRRGPLAEPAGRDVPHVGHEPVSAERLQQQAHRDGVRADLAEKVCGRQPHNQANNARKQATPARPTACTYTTASRLFSKQEPTRHGRFYWRNASAAAPARHRTLQHEELVSRSFARNVTHETNTTERERERERGGSTRSERYSLHA